MKIGAHESTAGGLQNAVTRATNDGGEALQIFVKSPNRWDANELSEKDIVVFKAAVSDFGIQNVTTHSAYLINLASPKDDVRDKSIVGMKDELNRCDLLDIPFYVLHPGSPLDSGFDNGMKRIIEGVDEIYADGNVNAMLLLEITAGMGTSIGGKLEHLQQIIDNVKMPEKVGICLDTCHMHASGYDIVNSYDAVIDEVFERFGEKLKVFHLNDSKGELGMHKDRHELIGNGTIGMDTFDRLVNDTRMQDVLGILETPIDENYAGEIALLKSLRR